MSEEPPRDQLPVGRFGLDASNRSGVGCSIVVLGLLLATARPGLTMPRCEVAPRDRPYPCTRGIDWTVGLGVFAGFRSAPEQKRGHFGGELSLHVGRLTDDGAHSSFRGIVYGLLLDLGVLTGPPAFRGGLELELAYPMGQHIRGPAWLSIVFGWIGISAGPSLTEEGGRRRAGFSGTLWTGLLIYPYLRLGTDLPWSPHWELGAFFKVPLRGW